MGRLQDGPSVVCDPHRTKEYGKIKSGTTKTVEHTVTVTRSTSKNTLSGRNYSGSRDSELLYFL